MTAIAARCSGASLRMGSNLPLDRVIFARHARTAQAD